MIVHTGKGDGEPAVNANGRLSFDIALKAGQAWHRCLIYDLVDGASGIRAPRECAESATTSDYVVKMDEWQRTVLKIKTSNEEFYRCYSQGVQDMAALRLPLEGTDHMVFVPAAGLPWFVALFGRDTLIVSLQTMIVYPEFAAAALGVLGQFQAKKRDDYRDAEPGKILHELRYGELAYFKMIPHTPYYGTADATPLYLVALHAAWQATGDRALIERHLPNAEACLTWIDKYGDRDGDGFQEYQTRSTVGYKNMAWKDSGDSVMYPDGTLVRGPKALCELQGYVYDAWLRMAEIYAELGNKRRANASAQEGGSALQEIQRCILGRGIRLLCIRIGRREEKGNVGGLQCRPMPVVRYHRAGTCSDRGEAADAQGHVEWLGYPHAVCGSFLVQSLQLSDRGGVAA